MEGEGRRKKIERMNEKRKSKSKKNEDSLQWELKTKAANNDRKLPPTLHGTNPPGACVENTDNAENGLKRRSKR